MQDLHILDRQDQMVPEAPHLTPTQMKVMRCVHSGLLNKQIAYELGMAEATVKVHMTALMRKLNVRNRTQVAIAASHFGWMRSALSRAAD
ncbi:MULTISPECIES: helix-turn-helix domain-containing protein [Sphingobium]|jgi:DNA-binding NarL/FixJ family response regulator|uniref:helix-turn-helix domain-containing protein n=1 Tax=Sphingobium TaxID=165695 RepID=UPI00243332CA|nr:LuxR C-terminal-related transcriptional regulator [Sphingobium yanoikuyae]